MVDDFSPFDSRPRLGRGLAALIGDSKQTTSGSDRTAAAGKAPIEFLYPNPRNPRSKFDEAELEELTSSIRHRGILQPILVRKIGGASGQYEIVAGERRWRAAQRAGLFEVPVLVLEINEREALEIAIIENVQRTDLNALDEARGYELLISEHGYTQHEVSRIVGKSRSHIANTMRLLALPDKTKVLLATGALSAGHARALLALADPDKIVDQVIHDGLTVRDIEKLGQGRVRKSKSPETLQIVSKPDKVAWEDKLTLALGTSVKIRYFGNGAEIRIELRSLEQLDQLCLRLLTPQDK
jgi:ParB family chromosome partitioning protein